MQLLNNIKDLLSRKIIHDISFTYVGSFINGISLFLINVMLARSLTQDWFGIFSLVTMALATIAEMSDFGLNGGLTRFAPYYLKNNQIEKLKQLVKTIWNWRVWMSVILTIGGILLADILARYLFGQVVLTRYLQVSFLGIGGVVMLGFTSTYLKASERFRYSAIIQSSKGVLRILGIGILLLLKIQNLFWFLGVYIVVPWLLFIFTYKILPKKFTKVEIDNKTKRQLHRQLARFSFWLTIWSLSAIVASRVDQIMISNMMSLTEVAIYATAFQFVFLYSIGLQSMSAVLVPKFSAFQHKEDVVKYIKRIMKYIVPVFGLLCVLIYISQYMFPLIFGIKYIDSVPIYLILSFGMAFKLLSVPYSSVIMIFNKTNFIAILGIIVMIINIILNYFFIPLYGAFGAGMALFVAYILQVVFSVYYGVFLLKKSKISVK